MGWNYNCPHCDRKWPHTKPFGECPVCRVACQTSTVGAAMTREEAELEFKRLDFDRFYAAREANRKGPSPEELGREDARTIIELDRAVSGVDGTMHTSEIAPASRQRPGARPKE